MTLSQIYLCHVNPHFGVFRIKHLNINNISHILQQHNADIMYKYLKLEAKDVLPNINHMQAAERAEKCHFCPW